MTLPFHDVSNDLLYDLMFNANTSTHNEHDDNSLLQMNSTPSPNDQFDSHADHLLIYDPDTNFVNSSNLQNCSYYSEESFFSLSNDPPFDHDASLSVFHMNIRSILRNFPLLEILLSKLNSPFPVITITESWLTKDNASLYNIPGYNHEFLCREKRNGGGVSIYVRKDLKHKVKTDLSKLTDEIECLFVEILSQKTKTLIGCIYRPPDRSIDDFTDSIQDTLIQLNHGSNQCILTGDFNIDLLKIDSHLPTSRYVDMLHSFSFLPYITKPTRLASKTLIDHIWVNDAIINVSGILLTDISDHCPTFLFTKSTLITSNTSRKKQRILSERNCARFSRAIAQMDWHNVIQKPTAQDAFTSFYQSYTQIYNSCFPYTDQTTTSTYKTRKPWLTTGMKNSIRTKNKLYIKYLKSPTDNNKKIYQTYRNKITSLLRRSEREHYCNLFRENRSNLRKTWTLIKDLLNNDRNQSLPTEFTINGNTIKDRVLQANAFNDHYTSVAINIHNKIPITNQNPVSSISKNPHSMYLSETNENEVQNIIRNLKDSSPGWDGLSGRIMKSCLDLILPTLTCLFNRCLLEGIFPKELKISKVIPIFKSGEKDKIVNYRPISLLPFASKILEKLIHVRMMSFIDKYDLLYKHQYGFRSKHITCTALAHVVDYITKANEKGLYTAGLFLDQGV